MELVVCMYVRMYVGVVQGCWSATGTTNHYIYQLHPPPLWTGQVNLRRNDDGRERLIAHLVLQNGPRGDLQKCFFPLFTYSTRRGNNQQIRNRTECDVTSNTKLFGAPISNCPLETFGTFDASR